MYTFSNIRTICSMKLKRRHKKILIGLVVSLLGMLITYLGGEQPGEVGRLLGTHTPGMYQVVSIEDGDTVTVNMNGSVERVRFIGVDTPETQDPRKPVQCFGRAASDFTKQLIGTHDVRLESDPLSSNRDRYDRLLRYIYLPDGRLVQAEIIREGYGFAYTSFPFTKSTEFKALETSARQQNKGLWGSCELTPNQYGGFTPNPE